MTSRSFQNKYTPGTPGTPKIWTGTQAEYDAIVTKDPYTVYIIT